MAPEQAPAAVSERTVSDLARALGISSQRLSPFVRRAAVEPVRIVGRRRFYVCADQGEVLIEFWLGQLRERGCSPPAELRVRVWECGSELGVVEDLVALGTWNDHGY